MADDEVACLQGKPLSSLRVSDLRQELGNRDLSKAGTKNQLIDRLTAQLLLEELQNAPIKDQDIEGLPNLRLQDEIGSENEYIRQYLAQQQQLYDSQKEAKRKAELEESEQIKSVSSETTKDFCVRESSHSSDNCSIERESRISQILESDVQNIASLSPPLFLEIDNVHKTADCLIKLDNFKEKEYPPHPELEKEEICEIKMENNKRRSSRVETILEFGEKSSKRRRQCPVIPETAVNKTERTKRKVAATQQSEDIKEKIQEKRLKNSNIESTEPLISKVKDLSHKNKNKNSKDIEKHEPRSKRTVRSKTAEGKVLVLEIELLNDKVISKLTPTRKSKGLLKRKSHKDIEVVNSNLTPRKSKDLLTRKSQKNIEVVKSKLIDNKEKRKKLNKCDPSIEIFKTSKVILEDFRLKDFKKLKKSKTSRKNKSLEIIENFLKTSKPEHSETNFQTEEFTYDAIKAKKLLKTPTLSSQSEIQLDIKESNIKKVMENKKSAKNPKIFLENHIEIQQSTDDKNENKKARKPTLRQNSNNSIESKESIDNIAIMKTKSTRTANLRGQGNHLEIKESIDILNALMQSNRSPRTRKLKEQLTPHVESDNSKVNAIMKSKKSRNETQNKPTETNDETKVSIVNTDNNETTVVKTKESLRLTRVVREPPETLTETKKGIDNKLVQNKKSLSISSLKEQPEAPIENKDSFDNRIVKTVRAQRILSQKRLSETPLATEDFIDNMLRLPRTSTVKEQVEILSKSGETIDTIIKTVRSRRAPILRGNQKTLPETKDFSDSIIIETKKSPRTNLNQNFQENLIEISKKPLREYSQTVNSLDNKRKATQKPSLVSRSQEIKEPTDNTVIKKLPRNTTVRGQPEIDNDKPLTKRLPRNTTLRKQQTELQNKITMDNTRKEVSRATSIRELPESNILITESFDNEAMTRKLPRTTTIKGFPQTALHTEKSLDYTKITKRSSRTTSVSVLPETIESNNNNVKKSPRTRSVRGSLETDLETKTSIDNTEITNTIMKRLPRTTTARGQDNETKEFVDNITTKRLSRATASHLKTDDDSKESIDKITMSKKLQRATALREQPKTEVENKEPIYQAVARNLPRAITIRGHLKPDAETKESINNTTANKRYSRDTSVRGQPKIDDKTKESIDNRYKRLSRATTVRGQPKMEDKAKESIDNKTASKRSRASTMREQPKTEDETKKSIDNRTESKRSRTTLEKSMSKTDEPVEPMDSSTGNKKLPRTTTIREYTRNDNETEDSIEKTRVTKKLARTIAERGHKKNKDVTKEPIDNTIVNKKLPRTRTIRGHSKTDNETKEPIDSTMETKKLSRSTTVRGCPKTENETSIDNKTKAQKVPKSKTVKEHPNIDISTEEFIDNPMLRKLSRKLIIKKHPETSSGTLENTKISSRRLRRYSETHHEIKEFIDNGKMKAEDSTIQEIIAENENFDQNDMKHSSDLEIKNKTINLSKSLIVLEEEEYSKNTSTLELNQTENALPIPEVKSNTNENSELIPEENLNEINKVNLLLNEDVNEENELYTKPFEVQINNNSETAKEIIETLTMVEHLEESSFKLNAEAFEVLTESSSLNILDDKIKTNFGQNSSVDNASNKHIKQFKKIELDEDNLSEINKIENLKDSLTKANKERSDESCDDEDDDKKSSKFLESECNINSNNTDSESIVLKSKIETNNSPAPKQVEGKAIPYLIKDILEENKMENIQNFEIVKDQERSIWEEKSAQDKLEDPFEDSKQIESDNSLESFEELVGSKNKQEEIKNPLPEEGDGDFETFQEILEQAALTTYPEVGQLEDESSEFIQKTLVETSESTVEKIDPPLSHIEDISKDSCENIPIFDKQTDESQELLISEKSIYHQPPKGNFALSIQESESSKQEVIKKYDLGNMNFLAIENEKTLNKDFADAFEVNKDENCHQIFSVHEPLNIESNFVSHTNLKVDTLNDEPSKNNEQNTYQETVILGNERQSNIGIIGEKTTFDDNGGRSDMSHYWNPYESYKTTTTNAGKVIEKVTNPPEIQNLELPRNEERFTQQENIFINREPKISESSSSGSSISKGYSSNNDRSTVIYSNKNRSRSRSPSKDIVKESPSRDHYYRSPDGGQQTGSRDRNWWTGSSKERDQAIDNRDRSRQSEYSDRSRTAEHIDRSRQTEHSDRYRQSGSRERYQQYNRRDGWGNPTWENQSWDNQNWGNQGYGNQSWERPWQNQNRDRSWQNRSRESPGQTQNRDRSGRSHSRERSWQPSGRDWAQ